MRPRTVSIRTGARLHFGPLSYLPESGRHFGGIGLMLRSPGVQLTAESPPPATRFGIHSPRATALLQTLQSQFSEFDLPVQIDLAEEIPPHAGLGSGTQLALAMAEALLRLHGRDVDRELLAQIGGRGDRSAVGLYGYEAGGFLVDAGHGAGERLGTLAVRMEFPAEWRILLLHPADALGLHGSVEMQAFHRLGSMSEQLTGRLSRLVLTGMLPALQAQNLSAFSAALFEYGQFVGEFFASTQNGVFASPQMRMLQQQYPDVAATGMAQSSWGPVVAMFAEHDEQAGEMRRRLWNLLDNPKCRIEITSACNRGRQIRIEP